MSKGGAFATLGRVQEEIEAYEEVVARFGNSKKPGLARLVARALVSKGIALGKLDRSQEQIEAYDEVVARFGNSKKPGLAKLVARALVSKGIALGKLDRSQEQIEAYDEVVARFGDSKAPGLAGLVAGALVNKGVALGILGEPQDTIRISDEVLTRFGDSKAPDLAALVARALVNKGIALGKLDRSQEELEAYDEAVARFGDNKAPGLAEPVARALVKKGIILEELGRYHEAEESLRKGILSDPESTYAHLELVKQLLKRSERHAEALKIARETISRKPGDPELLNDMSWTFYKQDIPSFLQTCEIWARQAVSLSPDNLNYHHTFASVLSALGKGGEALEPAGKYIADADFVEGTIDDAVGLFVELAAAGFAKDGLKLLKNSPAAGHLEPLVVGLQLYCGEDVKTAVEIFEVAKDVVKRIEDRKQLREKTQSA